MTSDPSSNHPPKQASARDKRLKAALKANLQRRKAQARARKPKNNDKKAG